MSELQGTTRDMLRAYVERIERVEEEQKASSDDKKAIYAEAKAQGFDTKTLRKVISLRKQDANERQEQASMLETYMVALGMQPDLPGMES